MSPPYWNGNPFSLIEFLLWPPSFPSNVFDIRKFVLFGSDLFHYVWKERTNALYVVGRN